MSIDRRRYIRPESLNLLDYILMDEQGQPGMYSMGRTLNVSNGGMLMETHIRLPKGQQVMVTLGLKEDLIDVTGKIVYTAEESGRYQNGIEFFHISDADRHILESYIIAFRRLYAEASSQYPFP